MGIHLGLGLTGLFLLQNLGTAKLAKYREIFQDRRGGNVYQEFKRDIENGLLFTIRLVVGTGFIQVFSAFSSLALAYALSRTE